MSSVLKWVGLAATVALVCSRPVMAQTTGGILLTNTLITSSFYSTGLSGWSFEITNCTYTGSTCGSAEVIPTATGSTLSLVFENALGTGTNLATAGGPATDLNVAYTVKAPGSEVIISATNSINGTGGALPNEYATVGIGITGSTATWLNVSDSGIANANGPVLTTAMFSPRVNSLSADPDGGAYIGNGTGSAKITSFSQTYSVPEPFSASLLGLGLAGVGFIRRKTRRAIAH